ncbi:MAG: hypothetical protein F9K16_02800 [Thermoanaerobaculia bacterium]|nr:MAG: hypothetical protein F9K16_02800 [Thermoanaerobaculia bacterium]MBZ0101973.1 hypothetical protein [Thermoanaerobaculia bacterium]
MQKRILSGLALGLILGSVPSAALREGEALYEFRTDASAYFVSSHPKTVVLFVSVASPQTNINRSFTLYGDGRIELTEAGANRASTRLHEMQLASDRFRELVGIAIEHGLAEYDETAIRARQLREAGSPATGGVLDGATTIVRIAVEQRAESGREPVELRKEIHMYAARHAAEAYPEIRELQGIKRLQDALFELMDDAGWVIW